MIKYRIILFVWLLAGYNEIANSQNELIVWSAPAGTPSNNTFSVQVKKSGDIAWTDLFEYNVKVGHQDELVNNSSMVNFDLSGTVDIKVTYNRGSINAYDIRPVSYGIKAIQNGNTLEFSVAQDYLAPRKIVIRINNSWETEVVHILTNFPEIDAPSEIASNVYVINPGDPIPFKLPEGKDTYYFKKGLHTLPKGLWVEVDLGATYPLNRFELYQGSYGGNTEKVKYIIESKLNGNDDYTSVYEALDNSTVGVISQTLPVRNARFVRLTLLGNNATGSYVFSSRINELNLYANGGETNLALNKAVAGAMPGYARAVDGNTNTGYISSSGYGNWHAGESFFLGKDGTTVYIAGGATVKGSFISDGNSNITIRGRGILDCSELRHIRTSPASEGRTGAVWLTGGTDNKLEGITILDPPMWGVVMNYTEKPVVKGINLFGSTVNADGIHFSGSNNGTVEGAFIRACDDILVMYHYGAANGNIVRNSVFWGDDAHIILIGLAGSSGGQPISNLTFQNLDILNQQGVWDLNKFNGCFKLWPSGENTISDVLFNNIRIDTFRDAAKSSIFQFRTDHRDTGLGVGSIKNITVQNITYRGSNERKSLLKGMDATHNVSGVKFLNYKRQGNYVTNESSGNIDIQSYVSDIKYFYNTSFETRNLALNKSANSDQPMYSGHGSDKAVDGTSTAYAQANSRTVPWKLTIDLDSITTFNRIVFKSASSEYASDYTIQGSNDGFIWITFITEKGGNGSIKTYNNFGNKAYRYVRLNPGSCILSPGDWGYTVLDFEIYDDSVTGTSSLLKNIDDQTKISIFPNPVANDLNIRIPSLVSNDNWNYHLTTAEGRIIQEGKVAMETTTLNLNGLSTGLYLLYLRNKNNKILSHKVIKKWN